MPEFSSRAAWRPGLALLVAGTFFMENLDGTVLTTAVPSIAADFRIASSDVGITMTAYLVTVAVFIALSGWLAERFGARRIFCLAIATFTVASLLCALSPDLTLLTFSRILQGLGGAMMVPVGSLVVLRGTPKSDLLRAIAYLTWPGLVAPVLAPLVGGFFTTYLSWHWIFLVNIPLGIVAFAVALRLVPQRTGQCRPSPGLARHGCHHRRNRRRRHRPGADQQAVRRRCLRRRRWWPECWRWPLRWSGCGVPPSHSSTWPSFGCGPSVPWRRADLSTA